MTDIITMPEGLYYFGGLRFNLISINASAGGSSFNPFTRSDGPSAEFWQIAASFGSMQDEQMDELQRFILRLRGGKVLARIYDCSRSTPGRDQQPMGAGGMGPVVNIDADATAGSETITLRSLLPNQPTALKALDHLGIGENLYTVADPAPSDAGGLSTIAIRPPLRAGVAAGDPVNLVKPTGLFRLTEGQDSFGIRPYMRSDEVTLSFIEEPMFG
jgi:hypothetical protein